LIRPISWPAYQASADRILDNVMPLLIVIVPPPQLCVPKMSLPDRRVLPIRPISSSVRFPKAHPLHQWLRCQVRWRAEQMHVIRHDDVPPNCPLRRFFPRHQQEFVRGMVRQKCFSVLCANREENDDRHIAPIVHRPMDGMLASDIFHHPWSRPQFLGRDRARPSNCHHPPFTIHICAITLSPNSEHLISVAPCISRAKS
jgi:hypothetical protein